MENLLNIIPAKYHVTVVALIALAPYVGRAWHALITGGGLKGIWSAVMFGTNQPKPASPVAPVQTPVLPNPIPPTKP